MRDTLNARTPLAATCLVLACFAFVLDALTPVGTAASSLYELVLVLALFSQRERFLLAAASVCTVLSAVALATKLVGASPFSEDLVLRTLTSAVVWATAGLGMFKCRADSYARTLAWIVDSTQDAVVAKDIKGRITHWNPAAERLYGYMASEVLGRHVAEVLLREPRMPEVFYKSTKGKSIESYETVHKRKDGSAVDVSLTISPIRDATGQISGISTIARDIGDRKRSERAIERSRTTMQTILSALPDRIARIDRTGKYLDDYSGQEDTSILVGKTLEEVLPRDIARLRRGAIAEALRTGRMQVYEYVLTAEDGGGIFEDRIVKTDIDEVLVVVRDLTEAKRTERELGEADSERRRLEEKIQQTQKLESLGLLAGGIAHDFNNLLMGILGNTSLAINDVPPDSLVRKTLDQIEKASKRAAELTRQLLAYSGKGRFQVQPFDLSELVEEMGHLLQITISKSASLRFELQRDLPTVEADATQIRQIVMNLITNASEAIGDRHGTITVATSVRDCDREYLDSTFLADGLVPGVYACVEVRDDGVGMDAETRSRIFDPFFTTKFTGRGLGLAAVLGIVRGHKGAIEVASEPGKGTAIRALLPTSDRPAQRDESAELWAVDLLGSGAVLVVDDEETVRTLARRMLERAGFSVLTAEDGEVAVEIFRTRKDEIRAVLLDLTMPRMSGEEAFRELRRIDPGVRVVLSSGYNEQDVAGRFEGKELHAFLQKPYRMKDLYAVLSRVLERGA